MKAIYDLGSPPPTRGTLTNQSTAEDAAGITPAYAGNTDIFIHKKRVC